MRTSRLATLILSLSFILFATAPSSAQLLDDTWFKLKVTGKGFLVTNADGESTKAKFRATAYMHIIVAPNALAESGVAGTDYTCDIWTETAPGEWTASSFSEFFAFGTDRMLFFVDSNFVFTGMDGAFFSGYQSARFVNKFDKQGDLKSSRYMVLGAELIEGTTDGTNSAVGGYKASGKMIPMSKLPFTP